MSDLCPSCFAALPPGADRCQDCGLTIDSFGAGMSYRDRLVHALDHPIDETRMGAIIALGTVGDPSVALPLVDRALGTPEDVWLAVEVVRSLHKLPIAPHVEAQLGRLEEEHPSPPVQALAAHVRAEMFTHGRGYGPSAGDLRAATRRTAPA